jgi:hypothetical protein
MPSLTILRPSESSDEMNWVRLSKFFPKQPHRLVNIEVALDAHWTLYDDTKTFWDQEQAEAELRNSVDTFVSWSGESEKAALLTWVNEVHGTYTVLAKCTGKSTETRRWWVMMEVHVPYAEGRRVLGP